MKTRRRPPADLPQLTEGHLNRALLARQHLLSRAVLPVERMVEHLAGLNAQDPQQAYVSLWSRLEGFRREDLEQCLSARRLVKAMLMRSTLHIVTARDFLRSREALQPVLSRAFRSFFREQAERLPLESLAQAAAAFASKEPRTLPQIRDHLLGLNPGEEPSCLAFLARTRGDLAGQTDLSRQERQAEVGTALPSGIWTRQRGRHDRLGQLIAQRGAR